MRKILILIAVVCLTATLPAEAKKRHLLILHTNDTHSCVLPLSSNLTDTALAGRGGFLRRMELVRQERQAHPDLLLFDSGDFSQGSPYYNLFKGDVEVGLMNKMDYDAATIGNHEFDLGLDNMARLFRLAQFPVVCANYDFTGTPVEGLVKPYVILKRNGLKIGVFGLSPQLESLVDNTNCVGVKYLNPAEKAMEMVAELKKKKCDVIICLSHLGWGKGGQDDQYLISHSSDIDLVLGGHTHTYLENLEYVNNQTGMAVPVDQNGKNGIWVGRIEMEFDNK